jgi:hypothetical protein
LTEEEEGKTPSVEAGRFVSIAEGKTDSAAESGCSEFKLNTSRGAGIELPVVAFAAGTTPIGLLLVIQLFTVAPIATVIAGTTLF